MPQDRDIKKLHPRLQEVANKLKIEFPNVLIYECLRSVEYQDELYAKGRTAPGIKCTNAKGKDYSSQHQWGIAFDFGCNEKGNLYPPSFMKEVGRFVKSLGCGWGGDWKNPVDQPHVYLSDWGKTTAALKKQYGTPDKFFATWDNPTVNKTTVKSTVSSYSDFIKQLQGVTGAKIDGIAGNETLSKLPTISAIKNNKHIVVSIVQNRLNELGYSCGKSDGIFGKNTTSAVISYQKANGCVSDGEITANGKTWKKLLGI